MKINPTSTTLSLILRSLESSVQPSATTPEAQSALHVIKLGLLDLLKRQGPSLPILRSSIRNGEALEHELATRLDPTADVDVSILDALPEELQTFEVLKGVYDALTARLDEQARKLSASARGDMSVEPLLRRLAAWENEYTTALLGVTASPFGDDPAIVPSAYDAAQRPLTAAYLAKFLSKSRGHPVEVQEFTPVTGGFGKQTFKAVLRHLPLARPNPSSATAAAAQSSLETLIIRKADPAPIMLHSAFKIETEYSILRALSGTDFPSPRPLELCTDPSLDGAFFTMHLVPGAIASSFLDNDDKASGISEDVMLQMATLLAQLHSLPLSLFSTHITATEGASALSDNIGQRYARNIQSWRRYLEREEEAHLPSPFMTWLLHWLEGNVPVDERRPVLTHGDYAVHNVLVEGGMVTGVLDWEGAEFSAPEQDLAYIRPHITKHLPFSTFLSHYTTSLASLSPSASSPPAINESLFKFGAAYSVMRTYLGGLRGQRNIQKGVNREIRYLMVEFGFAPIFGGMGLSVTEKEEEGEGEGKGGGKDGGIEEVVVREVQMDVAKMSVAKVEGEEAV